MMKNPKPAIGISACLLGRKVRYDGGTKRQVHLVNTLGKAVIWVPICPETECGLGMPREPMRLTGSPASPRLRVIGSGRDVTARMRRWIWRRLNALEAESLCGFVFKSKSPSCGIRNVWVFNNTGKSIASGAGVFARAFRRRFPNVPVTDEQKLLDAKMRRLFLTRVLAAQRTRYQAFSPE